MEEDRSGSLVKRGSNGEERGGWIQVQIYKAKQGGVVVRSCVILGPPRL